MLVSIAAIMLIVSTGTVLAKPDKKITICHNTGSQTVTLDINENALDAHLAHGDTTGPCQSPIPPAPELPTSALMGVGLLGLLFVSRRYN